ncbi:DUF5677 domain-containing protein [Pseudodesulfovibrio karagichevae]|uniref:DUF5677 domain-containing protein n=1 Tax=Pseudodesulfovibrio karagichevae TaxID=3239305 RepID=A0ABV4JZM8_9BACT
MDNENRVKQFEQIVGLVANSMRDASFDSRTKQTFLASALMCTIFENACSCLQLIKIYHYSMVPVLMRNLFEARIDFKNILKDSEYRKIMMAAYARQESTFFKGEAPDNPLYSAVIDTDWYKRRKRRSEEMDEKYKDILNNKEHLIKSRLEKAGDGGLYNTFYNWFCRESHNNIDALISRHIEEIDGRFQMVLFNDADSLRFFRVIGGILVESAEEYFKHIGQEEERIDQARVLYEELLLIKST